MAWIDTLDGVLAAMPRGRPRRDEPPAGRAAGRLASTQSCPQAPSNTLPRWRRGTNDLTMLCLLIPRIAMVMYG
jgi:hypothetical protein